jgi:general secretion pathway protein D
MGGLVRKNNSTSGTKLPLLADLPFIGGLFRSKARNLDESELLIFLTPTVVREPGVDYSVGPQAQR